MIIDNKEKNNTTFSMATSAMSYYTEAATISPEEYSKRQIKKYRDDNRCKIYWDEGMSDRQVQRMMEFLDMKFDVKPIEKQEDFLDAELFEL